MNCCFLEFGTLTKFGKQFSHVFTVFWLPECETELILDHFNHGCMFFSIPHSSISFVFVFGAMEHQFGFDQFGQNKFESCTQIEYIGS